MSQRSVPVDGPLLKQSRIEKAWSQERLARHAKVDPKTVIRAEASGRVDLDVLRRLAEAVGKDPKQLMRRVTVQSPISPSPATRTEARSVADVDTQAPHQIPPAGAVVSQPSKVSATTREL